MTASSRILILEDERPMRTALRDCLEAEGYRVLAEADGAAGLETALREQPDLILLDVMMPTLDGFSLCAELRRLTRWIPVLMLTAKGRVEDRVKGLDAGADDYLVKPFSTDELVARVRALLRRSQGEQQRAEAVQLGEVRIDFARQEARRGRRTVHLTSKEFAALRLLVEANGKAVSRERFLDAVWGYTAFPTTRTVDNHMASLRKKIESNPAEPRFIKTVHGLGYRLDRPETGGETLTKP